MPTIITLSSISLLSFTFLFISLVYNIGYLTAILKQLTPTFVFIILIYLLAVEAILLAVQLILQEDQLISLSYLIFVCAFLIIEGA